MAKFLNESEVIGPLGGIMLTRVILGDSSFANLTQQRFDDVYQSKVATLNVILDLVDLIKVDLNLLFSTTGTVFNDGWSPCLGARLDVFFFPIALLSLNSCFNSHLDKIAGKLPTPSQRPSLPSPTWVSSSVLSNRQRVVPKPGSSARSE